MSLAVPQTPQRQLPGTYVQTPAPTLNYRSGLTRQPNYRPGPVASQQQYGAQGQSQALSQQPQQDGQGTARPQLEQMRPVERASRTINEALDQDARYPELDSYVSRESSTPCTFCYDNNFL